jgi:hypothetical protein
MQLVLYFSCSQMADIIDWVSFYPIFPTPQSLAHEVNLDISHSDGLRLVDGDNPSPPDVLILPSKLKQFVKVGSQFFMSHALLKMFSNRWFIQRQLLTLRS